MAPDNGSGTYTLAEPGPINGQTGDATPITANLEDIQDALTARLMADGTKTPTANQPMGGFKHTNVADAAALTQYASAKQVTNGTLTYGGVAGGTADALTIAPSPGISAYAIGQQFQFKVSSSANTTAATLNVNSVGSGSITWPDGTALVAGDLPANAMVLVEVQATTPVFHLISHTRGTGVLASAATLTSTDASASAGPTLTLDRNSASPAASDVLGVLRFSFRDSGANQTMAAEVTSRIISPTNGAEQATLIINSQFGGTLQEAEFGTGLVLGAATGGAKGWGSLNASAMYVGGIIIGNPLQTDTLSSTATADFTSISSSHTGYEIELINVAPATDNVDFWLRLSGDGGSTYLTGSYQHSRHGSQAGTGADAGSASDSKILVAAGIGNATGESISGTIRVIYSGTAAFNTKVTFSVTHVDSTGAVVHTSGGGFYSLSFTLGGIRGMMSSGNMASGVIKWRPILA